MNDQYKAVSIGVFPACNIVLTQRNNQQQQLQIVGVGKHEQNTLYTLTYNNTGLFVCLFVCCHNSRIKKLNISDEKEKNRKVDALQWCLDVLQQHPTKLHAIDVGGTAEQSMADLWQMPAFSLFRQKFTKNSNHPFGQWIQQQQQAPLHQLRNICVRVDSDGEFDQLLQLLDGLSSPAQNRHFFGVRFDRSIDKNSFAMKLWRLLLLLRKKEPALDTLCLVLKIPVTPAMFDVLANQMHPNVTSFCLEADGFVIFCFRIHYTRLFHVK